MAIEEYSFGSITVNGKTYRHDVEVRWAPEPQRKGKKRIYPLRPGEVLAWQRKESHIIDVEDVKRAVEQNPDTIIIGIGESGIAKVTEEAKKFIKEKGIKLIIDKTEEAIRTFNVINEESEGEEGEQNKVIGLFHLTC